MHHKVNDMNMNTLSRHTLPYRIGLQVQVDQRLGSRAGLLHILDSTQ